MPTKKYKLKALVKRTVVDSISVDVTAGSLTEAYKRAEAALKVFPKPHEVADVNYIYIENRDNKENKVISLGERVDNDETA